MRNTSAMITWNKEHGVWNKKPKIKRVCPVCQVEFEIYPYKVKEGKGKYCSVACYRIATANPNRDEASLARLSPEYKKWRQSIFARDNFTCQECGVRPKWVEGHHLAAFMLTLSSTYRLEYGITLCRPCHFHVHGKELRNSNLPDYHRQITSPLIPCACGCGKVFSQYDRRGRSRCFIHGHHKHCKEVSNAI